MALAIWLGLVARAARRPGGKYEGGQPMRGLVQGGEHVGGGHPEVLKGICLPPGPGDELVQARGVQARVRVRQGPQGAPARGLAFHAEPQHFQFFQVAEG